MDKDKGNRVYLNGRFPERREAFVSAFDRGFLYGDGFFETTRILNGHAMFLQRHIDRLSDSCRSTDWGGPPDEEELTSAVGRLIKMNGLSDGYLRISVSRGLHGGALTALRAPSPTVLIEARPMELPPLNAAPPLTLKRSEYRKNEYSPTVRHKTLSYQDNLLALARARAAGADEVYFLNSSGWITEGAITNLFWVRKGTLYTPEISCGLLPGITRGLILEMADAEDRPHTVGRFGENQLLGADEVFCTNSLRGVIPVTGVIAGEKTIHWDKGPVTRFLAAEYGRMANLQ